MLDRHIHVLLGMKVDLLTSHLVFKSQLVRILGCTALAAPRNQPGTSAIVRQRILGHIHAVIHRTRNHRVIGIPIEKLNHYFVVDAWPEIRSPSVSSPTLSHAHPGRVGDRTPRILLIPEEPELYASQRIYVYLLTARTDNNCCLRAVYPRLSKGQCGFENDIRRNRRKSIAVSIPLLRIS